MNIGLLIGLTRARVALLIAGLAWFVGLTPDLHVRIGIAVLVLVALAFDGLVDEQRISQTKTTADRQHQTTH
ncbi:hypothetical protein OG875_04965 [Streptomyces sp. NBC_01498]|uniref:hypothetical protein n=1 Tax=Streptomyces sp. NBC_01498 TaxID=2975870 RepID=UPI002E7ABA95|nr:hypothetical protein [Streptomyces sp. NBC_01498]WTL24008.1 hypothetical protein OG875_04965 [Streptomyces sp. NBC_01498]